MYDDAISDVRRVDVRADLRDAACDLVARDERVVGASLHPIEEMEVRVAHARREDLNEDVLRAGLRIWQLDQLHSSGGFESNRPHLWA